MPSELKQIDEMAKLICTYPQCIHYNIIGGCKTAECQTVDIAENLYKQGYRKSSEVAEETLNIIENFFELFIEREYCFAEEETTRGHYTEAEAHDYAKDTIETIRQMCVAELKKKYTEGEK